jgi:hypothetical protein
MAVGQWQDKMIGIEGFHPLILPFFHNVGLTWGN